MQMSFDFDARPKVEQIEESNDYHRLPVSEKQLRFARQIAERNQITLPEAVLADRARLSQWIDDNKRRAGAGTRFSDYPSSRQVAFAERIARVKRRAVPEECFKDRKLMSHWIDSNT